MRRTRTRAVEPLSAISIHALTRSATSLTGQDKSPYQISIHALTRSATALRFKISYWLEISIHALTRSATSKLSAKNMESLKFQSTHSQGVRHQTTRLTLMVIKFQSTHSQGVRRQLNNRTMSIYQISIHALTRSATDIF